MLQPALAGGYKHRDDMIRDIAAALRQAAADEREQIAVWCDYQAEKEAQTAYGVHSSRVIMLRNIAEYVRARGTEQGK